MKRIIMNILASALMPFVLISAISLPAKAHKKCIGRGFLKTCSNGGHFHPEDTSLRKYDKFYLQNNCNEIVDASVEFQAGEINYFETRNYTFSPGERGYLFNTSNRYVYVTAKGRNGTRWDRQQVDLGSGYKDYTFNLTCN